MELDIINNQTQWGVQTALGIEFPGCMQVKACAWGSGVLSRDKCFSRCSRNSPEARTERSGAAIAYASYPVHFRAEWSEGEPQGLDPLTGSTIEHLGLAFGEGSGAKGRGCGVPGR
jgi:hypothetical protein